MVLLKSFVYFISAGVCLAAWIVLTFVMAIAAGWVHVPLAAAAVLTALGVIQMEPHEGRAGGA